MNDIQDQKVLDFLIELYGALPTPLRTYLTNGEAQELTKQHAQGRSVSVDCDLNGYAGKWRCAVEGQIRQGLDPQEWKFWHAARLMFLELGGCYQKGQEPPRLDTAV